jgi:hypothetical protein
MTRDGYGAFPLLSPALSAGSNLGCIAPPLLKDCRPLPPHGPVGSGDVLSVTTSSQLAARPKGDLDSLSRTRCAPARPGPGISAEGGWYLAERTFGS